MWWSSSYIYIFIYLRAEWFILIISRHSFLWIYLIGLNRTTSRLLVGSGRRSGDFLWLFSITIKLASFCCMWAPFAICGRVCVCVLCLFRSVPKHLAIHIPPSSPLAAAVAVALPSIFFFFISFFLFSTHRLISIDYRRRFQSLLYRDIGALGRDYGPGSAARSESEPRKGITGMCVFLLSSMGFVFRKLLWREQRHQTVSTNAEGAARAGRWMNQTDSCKSTAHLFSKT